MEPVKYTAAEAIPTTTTIDGITAIKPLHELRKEFGSQLCAKYGIYAASRMLRHADIAITAQHTIIFTETGCVSRGLLGQKKVAMTFYNLGANRASDCGRIPLGYRATEQHIGNLPRPPFFRQNHRQLRSLRPYIRSLKERL